MCQRGCLYTAERNTWQTLILHLCYPSCYHLQTPDAKVVTINLLTSNCSAKTGASLKRCPKTNLQFHRSLIKSHHVRPSEIFKKGDKSRDKITSPSPNLSEKGCGGTLMTKCCKRGLGVQRRQGEKSCSPCPCTQGRVNNIYIISEGCLSSPSLKVFKRADSPPSSSTPMPCYPLQ